MIDKHTLKTSEEWSRISSHVQILKHDGWKHMVYSEFEYAWFEELVSEREFFKRLSNSVLKIKEKK